MITMRISHTGSSTSKQTVIAGKTFEMGAPKSKLVRIYSRGNGALIASIKSDVNGAYKAYLPLDAAYTVVAIDERKQFNAVIQDNVVPK